MYFFLADYIQTLQLSRDLAQAIQSSDMVFPILLQGPLGSGKTTFVRGVAENLPGGNQAEVSSPSFNLVNIYPTHPEIIHIDLYRLSQIDIDESIIEHLSCTQSLIMIEWVENLPQEFWPEIYLKIEFTYWQDGRNIEIRSQGGNISEVIKGLKK